MEIEPLPCPFCGFLETAENDSHLDSCYFVVLDKWENQSLWYDPQLTFEKLMEAWNKRV